ncbi:MAG: D-glycero-beta-D-manno-heptose 1-phosphate adenylyltransferase [Bdellovibrionales bacterium]|nr:D-glycero-beta-D-manno-heptose 1-phosphate adenylyltransferase [Bdellovibrionales bacterium]
MPATLPADWLETKRLADECRARGGLVVTTNGCFDLLHRGHVSYLTEARRQGDLLLVGINSDASVRKIKGPERPLNDEKSRAYVLAALRCVDGVAMFPQDTPLDWLQVVRPHIHVKGGDWNPATMVETPVLAAWGGRVMVLPYVEGFSTTNLIEKARTKK